MTFLLFLVDLNKHFVQNYMKYFLTTVSKCAIAIMIIKIMNAKSFLERHFVGFQFKYKLSLMKKLYCIQPLGCLAKLEKFNAIYLLLTK